VLAAALHTIGIKVGMFTRPAGVHSSATILCDKFAFVNPNGNPTNGEPIGSALREIGIWDGALLPGLPSDLRGIGAHEDVPMIVIGTHWPIRPATPYVGQTEPIASATSNAGETAASGGRYWIKSDI
jgi:hypothetical protein